MLAHCDRFIATFNRPTRKYPQYFYGNFKNSKRRVCKVICNVFGVQITLHTLRDYICY